MDTNEEQIHNISVYLEIMMQSIMILTLLLHGVITNEPMLNRRKRRRGVRYSIKDRLPSQISNFARVVELSDVACLDNLRMNRSAFGRLCYILEHAGGLEHSRNVMIPEKVARFLSILAHHKKIRIVAHDYQRSGETVSKHFHEVLSSVLAIHKLLLVVPTPVDDQCDKEKWMPFKGCLGALDGSYVNVRVNIANQARYRNRKQHISVNALGVCNRDMNFVYILTGWEGSAHDGRVLRDAIGRANGLKVPKGMYYLCDAAYTNGEGFLAPYRGARYHLKEWGPGSMAPMNHEEYFNMKHSSARNVIERTFGLFKMRWAVLRSPTFYPIKIQNRIIMACALLHNFIRREHPIDPIEYRLDLFMAQEEALQDRTEPIFIDGVEATPEWTNWRDTLALNMYNEWTRIRNSRRR